MATTLTSIAFAQSACDIETKKAKAISDRCSQTYTSNQVKYNKCLEKYKVPSLLKQIKSAQTKCSQKTQSQIAKATDDYTKCQEASNYIKCAQEYQSQATKAKSDYAECPGASSQTKCLQEHQARLMQIQATSGLAKCMEEYKSQLAQGVKTAVNDYTKCTGAAQAIYAEATSDYTKCLEDSGYNRCQQEYQAQTNKSTSDYAKCLEDSGYNKCQQEYQARLTQDRECSEEYKALSEKVTSGQTKCQQEQESQVQQVKIDTKAQTKCMQEYITQKAKADKICPSPVHISELEKRGDVYFMKNKPYSGKVNCSDCYPCGYSCDANMKDGKFHGKLLEGDEEGYSLIGNYIDGKKQGEWKWSHDDYFYGNESSGVEYYKDGKEHGEWKSFYGSGELKSIERYNNGKKHGESKGFYINGNLQSVTNYKNGKLHGEMKTFDYDGKLIKTINYIDDVEQKQ
ncbi:MAG: toxin-antitoxin system YwqK family antitoxin [Fibromonadaceae bacterium]|nr:toxin-antitoxin system YwqK family antitoxin [Fibromonadaceae bacterium]